MTLAAAIREARAEARALNVQMVVIEVGRRYFPARRDWLDALPDDAPRRPHLYGDVSPCGTVQCEW